MANQGSNVQRVDILPLDMLRKHFRSGIARVKQRQRWFKFSLWRGKVEGGETITILEVEHDRR